MSTLFGVGLLIIVFWLLLGSIPAAVAQSKGRDFATWVVYGAALFPVALVHALVIRPDSSIERWRGKVRCSRCREFVQSGAMVCPYCE